MRRYSAPMIEDEQATIKAHDTRDGVAQTLISRPKVL